MSNQTYEEALAEIFAPWFTDGAIPAGEAVGTPREAARKAIVTAMDAPTGTRGAIRIIADSPYTKRAVRNLLKAMFEHKKLRPMVKKLASDAIHLHGGLRLELDLNDQRLVSNTVATIRVDPSVNGLIGHIWQEAHETPEEAAIRCGFAPEQLPRLMVIRWLRPGEEPAEIIPSSPEGRCGAGPPVDTAQDPVGAAREPAVRADEHDRLAQEQRYREAVERLERERINEKLAEGYRKMGGVA
jgi:hypothetical protein